MTSPPVPPPGDPLPSWLEALAEQLAAGNAAPVAPPPGASPDDISQLNRMAEALRRLERAWPRRPPPAGPGATPDPGTTPDQTRPRAAALRVPGYEIVGVVGQGG